MTLSYIKFGHVATEVSISNQRTILVVIKQNGKI
jgi:hypothetical protein